jgi:Holliday junction resolvase-like predicted endonuclease
LQSRGIRSPGIQGELDVVAVLAFVEVKTRAVAEPGQARPEDAINLEKRRNLARRARQFLRASAGPNSVEVRRPRD